MTTKIFFILLAISLPLWIYNVSRQVPPEETAKLYRVEKEKPFYDSPRFDRYLGLGFNLTGITLMVVGWFKRFKVLTIVASVLTIVQFVFFFVPPSSILAMFA